MSVSVVLWCSAAPLRPLVFCRPLPMAPSLVTRTTREKGAIHLATSCQAPSLASQKPVLPTEDSPPGEQPQDRLTLFGAPHVHDSYLMQATITQQQPRVTNTRDNTTPIIHLRRLKMLAFWRTYTVGFRYVVARADEEDGWRVDEVTHCDASSALAVRIWQSHLHRFVISGRPNLSMHHEDFQAKCQMGTDRRGPVYARGVGVGSVTMAGRHGSLPATLRHANTTPGQLQQPQTLATSKARRLRTQSMRMLLQRANCL